MLCIGNPSGRTPPLQDALPCQTTNIIQEWLEAHDKEFKRPWSQSNPTLSDGIEAPPPSLRDSVASFPSVKYSQCQHPSRIPPIISSASCVHIIKNALLDPRLVCFFFVFFQKTGYLPAEIHAHWYKFEMKPLPLLVCLRSQNALMADSLV